MEETKEKKRALFTEYYTEAFKRSVCEEYLATGVSKMALLRKYKIRYKSGIQKWLLKYGYEDIHRKGRYLGLPALLELAAKEKNDSSRSSTALFKARIKELETLLEDERLRSEAFERMLVIAEKEFNFPIRKKPSTK